MRRGDHHPMAECSTDYTFTPYPQCTVLASCIPVQPSEWSALPEVAYSSFTVLPRSRPSSQLFFWFVQEEFHRLTSSTPQVFCPGLPAGASQPCPGLGQAPNWACGFPPTHSSRVNRASSQLNFYYQETVSSRILLYDKL